MNCGCCWAFCSTAYIESFTVIKFNKTYDLSEEYVLECTPSSDCGGGYVSKAMNLSQSGMSNESTYSYTAGSYGTSGKPTTSGICTAQNRNPIPAATVIIYNNVTDSQLKNMIVDSPIPALIDATNAVMSYSSGILACNDTPTMNISNLNHAIQLIGYDSNGNYLIKNSWGTSWGVNGFGTVSSTLDCGIKLVVYQFQSSLPSVVTLSSPPMNSTNSTTNNSTNNKLKSELNMAFMFVLAFLSMIIMT